MARTKKPATIRVVLKAPVKIADFLVFAQKVHDQMAANASTLPSPNPPLPTLQAQIATLTTKEALTKTRATGAVADRDQAQLAVKTSLESEAAYVEELCNADPSNALVLAQDAGLSLKATGSHTKPPLAVKASAVSGSVNIVAKATTGAKQNQWEYSLDGGKTWIDLPPTTKAKTTLASLTPGTTVTVRQRVFTKAGLQDWSQPVSSVVT
jgi:hypothetical protein